MTFKWPKMFNLLVGKMIGTGPSAKAPLEASKFEFLAKNGPFSGQKWPKDVTFGQKWPKI